MEITVETVAHAPPDIVFTTMIDIPRWPDFIDAIEGVEMITDVPVRVGTRFRETRKMHGRTATEEMTVAELAPPHRFVLTAENHGARYVATHTVSATAEGTRLTLSFAGTPVTLLACLLSVLTMLFAGSVRRMLQRDLEQLKTEAERRAQAV